MTVLASIPSPSRAVWYIGSVPIRAYALCIVAGIVVACVVTDRRLRARGAPKGSVLDIALWAVPAGIIGARIYHVLTDWNAYFGPGGTPIQALEIWKGGLGIWGAVLGGAFGAWFGAKRLGIPLTVVADCLAPGLPLAQAIGRLGNWFNNELYGGHTTLPWGLQIHKWGDGEAQIGPDGKPILLDGLYQPTFLYELVWDLGVALLVYLLDKKFRFGKGRAFALYVLAYTAGRVWIEALRTDTADHILGIRLNVFTSIIVFLGALLYLIFVHGPRLMLVTNDDGTLRAVPEGATATEDADEPVDTEPIAAEESTRDGPAPGDETAAADESSARAEH